MIAFSREMRRRAFSCSFTCDGVMLDASPLYPRKRTSISAVAINLVGVSEFWYARAFSEPKEPSFCGRPRNDSPHLLERTSDSLDHSHT